MGQNTISVIVPIYGVEKYLRECVDSILKQTYRDIEVILVDDASKDNCPAICDDYAKKDSRVKVIHKPNGGVMSARKAGADVATGEYIISVDGDDYIKENLIENIQALISQYGSDAVVYSLERFYEDNREVFDTVNYDRKGLLDACGVDQLRKCYLFDINTAGLNGGAFLYSMCTKAIRRDLYIRCLKAVPDNITNGEDTLFTMKLLMECRSLYMSGLNGYMYRCRHGSAVHRVATNDFTMLRQLLTELRKIQGDRKDMDNQIAAYMITRINAFATNAVDSGMSYKEFRSYMEAAGPILEAEPVRHGVKLKRGSRKDEAMVYLYIHKMWQLLYLYKKSRKAFRNA